MKDSRESEMGHALPGVEIELRDGEGLEFSGPGVCLAVVEGNQVSFPKKILLRDCVKRRPDGRYVFEGRSDLVLNRGGIKVSLEKVEEFIKNKADLEAICVSVPDLRLGEELGVLIRHAVEPPFDRERVQLLLRQEFGHDFNPERIIAVSEFPLNESLKLDRSAGVRLVLERVAQS